MTRASRNEVGTRELNKKRKRVQTGPKKSFLTRGNRKLAPQISIRRLMKSTPFSAKKFTGEARKASSRTTFRTPRVAFPLHLAPSTLSSRAETTSPISQCYHRGVLQTLHGGPSCAEISNRTRKAALAPFSPYIFWAFCSAGYTWA